MRNRTFSLTERVQNLPQGALLKVWLAYHIFVAAVFLLACVIFRGQITLDSDLFNLVPKSVSMESVRKADEKMLSVTSQNVFILVAHEDFLRAKNVAEQVFDALDGSENFREISLYNDVGSMTEITDFLYKFRWNLIDEKTADFILGTSDGSPGGGSGADEFALNALSKAYGGFTLLPLDNLDSDPFLLTEYNLINYLDAVQNTGTAMSVKDGVLASQFDGKWYVMIRGILSAKGAKLAAKSNAITEIYDVCARYADAEADDSPQFVFSGTPFHSHESSTSASREVSVIATLSMLAVIVLLVFIFRSPRPLFYSVGSILVSVGIAVLATLAVFHKMHVITLVFGTSLIGSSIDYSLHFFTHWAGNRELKSSLEIRNHIFSGLLMAIVSTGICFAILLFAPFTILRQMSLFCLAGLVSSFLTTIAVYPYIPLPQVRGNVRFLGGFTRAVSRMQRKWVGRMVISLLFALSIICVIVFHKNVRIKNNLLTLYNMEGRLLDDEITAAQVIQYTPGGWYIVSGDSEDDALLNEERLRREFEDLTGGTVGYVSASRFVPSKAVQEKSRAAYAALLARAESQFAALGFSPDDAAELSSMLQADFSGSSGEYVSFSAGNIPDFIVSAISSAWLGNLDGKYYTVLLPTNVTDYFAYRSLCETDGNAFFISKSQDISADLDSLTVMVLCFFAAAYALMLIILRFFYTWKQSLKIISVPVLIILVVVAVFAVLKIDLEFFSITGLILVFGLGLDYIIYMTENEKKLAKNDSADLRAYSALEPFATMVSFVTTIISFGALALSAFKPVHLIGLSVFIGLATAYTGSFFYGRVGSAGRKEA